NDYCSQTESEYEAVSIVSTIQTTRGKQDPAKKIRKEAASSTQVPDYWTQKLEEARHRLASLQCESEKLESAYDRWRASNMDKTVKFESPATNNKLTTLLTTAGSTSLTPLPPVNLKTLWNQYGLLAPAFSYPFERTTTCNTVTTEQKSSGGPIVSREILTSCPREPSVGSDKISEKQCNFREGIASDSHNSYREVFQMDKPDRTSPASELSIEINDVVENSRSPVQPTRVLSEKLSDAATCEASCFEFGSKSNIHQDQLGTSSVRGTASSSILGNISHSPHALELPTNKALLSSTFSSNANEQQSNRTTEKICINTLQNKLAISNHTETVVTDSDDSDLIGEHDANKSASSIRKSIHSPKEIVDLSDKAKPTGVTIAHVDRISSPIDLPQNHVQLNQEKPAINDLASEEQVASEKVLDNKQFTFEQFLRAKQFSASEYEPSQSEDDRLSFQVPEMDNMSTAREDSGQNDDSDAMW
ncbi:hypothetical protein EG68_08686, partial [Paragonimus skrjabini miyazakii]